MNWVSTLMKAATSRGSGLYPGTWDAVEGRAALPVPPELRALYEHSDGAVFSGEIRLWPWKEVEENSARPRLGLKPGDAWQLGTKRETGVFFAAPGRKLVAALPASQRPVWLKALAPGEFVYGVWRGPEDIFVVRSLEELLTLNLPREGEDFGEVTYVRAMAAVREALKQMEPAAKPKAKSAAKKPKGKAKRKA